jgi:hypothetical protein
MGASEERHRDAAGTRAYTAALEPMLVGAIEITECERSHVERPAAQTPPVSVLLAVRSACVARARWVPPSLHDPANETIVRRDRCAAASSSAHLSARDSAGASRSAAPSSSMAG